MASLAFLFISACALLFAGGTWGRHCSRAAADTEGRDSLRGWAPRGLMLCRAAEEGAGTGPGLARRALAARLGGAKGSSPVTGAVKGAVHPKDAAVLLEVGCPVAVGGQQQ